MITGEQPFMRNKWPLINGKEENNLIHKMETSINQWGEESIYR